MGGIKRSVSRRVRRVLWVGVWVTGLCASAEESRLEADVRLLKKVHTADETDLAVQKGLAWLVTKQDARHGNFGGTMPQAYTALSCLALLAAGEQPGRSKYGQALQKGILYLVDKAEKNQGYLGGDGGRMYGHAMATLVLCEAYGMLDSPETNHRVGRAIDAALTVTIRAQVRAPGQYQGGWRYEPDSQDADLSVTTWQVLTLRAAKNCGFDVPDKVMQAALTYVRGLYSGAGFSYQSGHPPSPAMQAAGIVCLKMLGTDPSEADKAKIATVAKSLRKVDPAQGRYYYYQSYYLATANNLLSEKDRSEFLPKLEKSLRRLQGEDGQFAKHSGHAGGIYSTAFALISLSARYQYLPIYQE